MALLSIFCSLSKLGFVHPPIKAANGMIPRENHGSVLCILLRPVVQ